MENFFIHQHATVPGFSGRGLCFLYHLKPLRQVARATPANLAEEEISPVEMAGDGSVTIHVAGHQIVNIKLSDQRQFNS